MGKSSKQKTVQQPRYPAALQPIAAREADLFGNVLLPLENAATSRLLGLLAPDRGTVEAAAAPQLNAAMQAAAAMGGAAPRFGGGVSPDRVAQFPQQLIAALRAAAPDALAGIGMQLLDPRVLALLQPATEARTIGGGPGALAQGLGTASTLATLAMFGIQL